MTVGIIGAGASGMAAALAASDNPNTKVILLERQAKVGRKLMATGNGRCNLSNIHTSANAYHGGQPDFVMAALDTFGWGNTCHWFEAMGLYTVTEPSGRIYPYSDQANSVVDILRLNLNRPNLELRVGFEVQRVKRDATGFLIVGAAEQVHCDRLIIACGGLAGSKLGGSMSGYKLLSKLGHKCSKLRPALVQLKAQWSGLSSLKGVRANCCVKIFYEKQLFAQSVGELQFTEYGLSGPVIFEISRDVCAVYGKWYAVLDLLPDRTSEQLMQELCRRSRTDLPTQELLTGILHNRLGRVLCQAVGISLNGLCKDLRQSELQAICSAVKGFEIPLTEPMGMDCAQVTAGGVLTEQFEPKTMESKLIPGLYACGEVLDIDGDCGGYNLQWAWSSGRLAGSSAGKEM